MGVARRFRADRSGATAVVFSVALLPLVGMAGAAVDYSRAALVATDLQRAVDATALALVKEPRTASATEIEAKGRLVFASLFGGKPQADMNPVAITRAGSTIDVKAQGAITNAFMQVVGVKTTKVGAQGSATWGQQRIELALVLDNTGSMADTISGKRKIDELKRSAGDLVDKLKKLATEKDAVRVSVVPFNTEVRLDPATYRNADWLHFDKQRDRRNWTGYVIDRHQPYDADDSAPDTRRDVTLYPALKASESASSNTLAYVRPITSLSEESEYRAVKNLISSMEPRGNTNVALGVAWGLGTLTGSIPLGAPASTDPRSPKRFMVILTDGDNTQNHVNGTPNYQEAPINDRTALTCRTTKSAGIEVFTIRLMAGNENLLRNCASSASNYFDVKSDTDLTAAFGKILNAISATRLSS